MKYKKPKDLSLGMVEADGLANIPDQIESAGGYRKQIADHIGDRAETLSDVVNKIKQKAGVVGKVVGSPVGKKLMGGLPLIGGLLQAGTSGDASAAIDPFDSEEAGLNSDLVSPLQNEEALLNVPAENFADQDVSEQARRWQKIRGMME